MIEEKLQQAQIVVSETPAYIRCQPHGVLPNLGVCREVVVRVNDGGEAVTFIIVIGNTAVRGDHARAIARFIVAVLNRGSTR